MRIHQEAYNRFQTQKKKKTDRYGDVGTAGAGAKWRAPPDDREVGGAGGGEVLQEEGGTKTMGGGGRHYGGDYTASSLRRGSSGAGVQSVNSLIERRGAICAALLACVVVV